MTADRTTATRRADHLLDDITNVVERFKDRTPTAGTTPGPGIRKLLASLIHADTAGGQLGGIPLSATGYDGDGIRGSDPSDPVGDRAARNIDQRGENDQVHEMRLKAEGYARDAANALHALQNVLGAFALLRSEDVAPPPVRYCACARHREVNRPAVHHAATTVGRRLAEPADLCGDCYEAVRRTADSDSRAGRLPTADEVRHHDRHGRWPYAMQRHGAA